MFSPTAGGVTAGSAGSSVTAIPNWSHVAVLPPKSGRSVRDGAQIVEADALLVGLGPGRDLLRAPRLEVVGQAGVLGLDRGPQVLELAQLGDRRPALGRVRFGDARRREIADPLGQRRQRRLVLDPLRVQLRVRVRVLRDRIAGLLRRHVLLRVGSGHAAGDGGSGRARGVDQQARDRGARADDAEHDLPELTRRFEIARDQPPVVGELQRRLGVLEPVAVEGQPLIATIRADVQDRRGLGCPVRLRRRARILGDRHRRVDADKRQRQRVLQLHIAHLVQLLLVARSSARPSAGAARYLRASSPPAPGPPRARGARRAA